MGARSGIAGIVMTCAKTLRLLRPLLQKSRRYLLVLLRQLVLLQQLVLFLFLAVDSVDCRSASCFTVFCRWIRVSKLRSALLVFASTP